MKDVTRTVSDNYVEYQFWTPAGEDFSFTVSKANEEQALRNYAENFDVSEHVELWVDKRGTNGVPVSIRELVEDAEWIRDRLLELAEKQ